MNNLSDLSEFVDNVCERFGHDSMSGADALSLIVSACLHFVDSAIGIISQVVFNCVSLISRGIDELVRCFQNSIGSLSFQ